MTLLVFGGTGFVGSSLINRQKENEKIISFSSKKIEIIKKKSRYNIKYSLLKNYLKQEKENDAIFCASTRYDPKKYINNTLGVFENNINSIIKFLKILDNTSVRKVILISSYAIYGNKKSANSEESNVFAKNFSIKEFYYAQAKLLQENLIINFCKKRNIKYNILRLPSIYGPGSTLSLKNSHVIPSFVIQILKKKKHITIHGNGTEKKEFIYIFDLIKIILILRKKNFNGIINVGSNKFLSIKTLLNIIIKLTNSKVITQYNNQSFSDIPLRKVNYLKLKSHFKNFKFKEITNGLRETVNWYKKKLND